MTKNAQLDVKEGSLSEYVCETDCAYPGPPIVLWYVADQPVDGHANNSILCKDYNGHKTNSTLRLTTTREMNTKIVKCALENDDTIFDEHNLNVTCKY